MKKIIWLAALVSILTHADDIEIYQGQQAGSIPNLMLVMDTSRSMSRYVPTSRYGYRYDPAITYPKPINGYETDGIYLSRATGELYNGDGSTASEVKTIRQHRIDPRSLKCDQAWTDIANQGYYSRSKLKRWVSGSGWSGPAFITFGIARSIPMNPADLVDCQDGGPYDYNGSTYNNMQSVWLGRDKNRPYTNSGWPNKIEAGWAEAFYNRVFSGNYLNYQLIAQNDNGTDLKISRMVMSREAIREGLFDLRRRDTNGNLIPGAPEKNYNVGLARFDTSNIFEGQGGDGGYIDAPIAPVKNQRDDLINKMESYFPWGKTPLTETYYETFQYMTGGPVGYGQKAYYREPGSFVIRYWTGLVSLFSSGSYRETQSVATSRSGGSYLAPEVQSCTQSSIILFTDGAPWADSGANAAIRNLIRDVNFPDGYSKNCGSGSAGDPADGGCADELAYYLANEDQYGDLSDGKQTITTHVIGAFLEEDRDPNSTEPETKTVARQLLEKVAQAGNGNYYAVSNYESIRDAFSSIVDYTEEISTSLTSATVAVNSFNRLESSDQIYFSMFQPSKDSKWCGNLKRYRIDGNKGIVDAKGNTAVNERTGEFKSTSRSFWTDSDTNDGNEVKIGGIANTLELERNIYTSLNGTSLTRVNDSLDSALLYPSDSDDAYVSILKNWIAGKNADGSVRKELEDPLHSQPVVINYGAGDTVAFIGTNSGYLHAFNTDENNPSELFAFIPKELLHNPNQYLSPTIGNKVYGLDGPISYWHDDKNLNGIVDGSDKLILYVGMRRGGHSYYALDVTNKNSPKLQWQIHGKYQSGSLNTPSVTSGFNKLGQTWSKLTPAEIVWEGSRRVVLFAGAGYDVAEDGSSGNRLEHDQGATIYVIDAKTGDLLWDAEKHANLQSGHELSSAFTADLVPIDRNADGAVDMFYATDIGGRLWRFDLNSNSNDADDFAKGGIIADIYGGSGVGNRRIYNKPDISYFFNKGNDFILISFGSGYRAHPLSRGESDYFFMIKDHNALVTPNEYETVSFANLTEWGSESDKGWRYPLPRSAEKVLNPSITHNGQVLFTAYKPVNPLDPNTGIACQPDVGSSKLYSLNVHSNGKEAVSVADPEIPGIPPVQLPPTTNPAGNNGDTPGGGNGSPPPPECQTSGSLTLVGLVPIESQKDPACDKIVREYWKELSNEN